MKVDAPSSLIYIIITFSVSLFPFLDFFWLDLAVTGIAFAVLPFFVRFLRFPVLLWGWSFFLWGYLALQVASWYMTGEEINQAFIAHLDLSTITAGLSGYTIITIIGLGAYFLVSFFYIGCLEKMQPDFSLGKVKSLLVSVVFIFVVFHPANLLATSYFLIDCVFRRFRSSIPVDSDHLIFSTRGTGSYHST